MLTHLLIENFAIIARAELALDPGFNVLTGDTGAGKSIIVDAVSRLLGGRADSEDIRAGAEEALIEGVFALSGPEETGVRRILIEHGLADSDADSAILSRQIVREGRNLARINGRAVTLSLLREVGQQLVDIHNQGQHLSLLRVSEHIAFLDRFGELVEERSEVADRVRRLSGLRREMAKLFIDERELARRVDRLRFQVDEIDAARLKPDEEEALVQEHARLANAERLMSEADSAFRALDEEGGSLERLSHVRRSLSLLAEVDPAWREQKGALDEAESLLADLASALRGYRDKIEFLPDRLEEVSSRLAVIDDLKRKYGATVEEVLAFAAGARRELDDLSHTEERLEALAQEEIQVLREIAQLATALSDKRRKASGKLSAAMQAELQDLAMDRARFQVGMTLRPDARGVEAGGESVGFDQTGIDRVEFQVAPNPGEPLKPLARIASGGETARLVLALKTALVGSDPVPTLIFDEIDAGLGGRAGEVVGRKLWALTQSHQVLCVTHLPQIAALADTHFQVRKESASGRTVTRLKAVRGKARIGELAAMIGTLTEKTRLTSEEMLERAQSWKEGQRGSA